MAPRGRVSAEAIAARSTKLTVINSNGVIPQSRPRPPVELTEEQAEEWQQIVNRMPADWFPRETWPMLVQYCRLIGRSHRIAILIQRMEGAKGRAFDQKEYRDLCRSEQQISSTITSLAVKMRLSQTSTMKQAQATWKKPSASQTEADQSNPWDDEPEDIAGEASEEGADE